MNERLWTFRIVATATALPYWIGVFSGWYSTHMHATNSNPDIWVHSGVMALTCLLIRDAIKARWAKKGAA